MTDRGAGLPIPANADERAQLLDAAGLLPAEREAVEEWVAQQAHERRRLATAEERDRMRQDVEAAVRDAR